MPVLNDVRGVRARLRLSQAELARLAGTTRQTIASIEAGESVPSVDIALRVARALDRSVDELFRLAGSDAPRETLVVAGSDDPGLALLADLLRERDTPLLLSLSPVGSTAGLAAIASGGAEVAGIHLDDNAARLRETLPDGALVRFARREQGFLLADGVEAARVEDLAGRRLVLRRRGSGTRALFERLAPAGLARRVVAEAPTHDQVAAPLVRHEADAGTATRATAVRYGLRFLPLAWERFDLALHRALLEDRRVGTLRAALADDRVRRAIEALRGYDLEGSGEVLVS